MAKLTKKTTHFTSFFFHTVTATVAELEFLFGQAQYRDNDGTDKVNYCWDCETDAGEVFTIYDWKNYRPLARAERVEWHIGAFSDAEAGHAQDELLTQLSWEIV